MERKKGVKTSAFLSTPLSSPAIPPVETTPPAAAPQTNQQAAPQTAPRAVNTFGNIDDLISMMGKFQKLFGMYQSMQPAFKMFGSFLGPTAAIKSTSRKNKRTSTKSKNVNKKHVSKASTTSKRIPTGKKTKLK